MRAVRPFAMPFPRVLATFLIAAVPLYGAAASDALQVSSDRLVIAQTSMGSPEPVAPTPPAGAPAPAPLKVAPTVPIAPPPAPAPVPPPLPRTDYIPPQLTPNPPTPNPSGRPSPNPAPNPSETVFWGAIGFTADGSYSSTWRMASQAEAEARVARKCAEFGRGGCQVSVFSGQECAALTTFIGNYRRRRWSLSFTAGGMSYPEAQNAAMERCNSDERTQGRCQPRTAACADGR